MPLHDSRPIFVDFETLYPVDLRKEGALSYILHEGFRVICCVALLPDDRWVTWVPQNEPPVELFAMVEAGIPLCAHNANKFDAIIWERVLKWPKPQEWVDTCAIAWSLNLQGSLESLGQLVGRAKDEEGQKLVIALNERYRKSR